MCRKCGGGAYSLLCANVPLKTAARIRSFAQMCVDSHVAGMFLYRTHDARLSRELLALFRDAKIPVVLLGGDPPPHGYSCDLVGMNYIASGGRRTRVNPAAPSARCSGDILPYGELFGDVAVRLMLQRLAYGPRHPPAEVFLDIPATFNAKTTTLKRRNVHGNKTRNP